MIETSVLFKEKNFPDWIKSHRVFNSVKKINKVFSGIGLSNCEKEIQVDNKTSATTSAKYLLSGIRDLLAQRADDLVEYKEDHPKMGKARSKILDNCISLTSILATKLAPRQMKNFITIINNRITLNLSEDIFDADKKVVFKKGEGLFRVYNKLNELLREGKFLAMEKLENLSTFKTFSTNNVPSNKFLIRFSSDGSEGAWDIATMSMRGIQSCQTWGAGNSVAVIGSIVDPFTAIIYLTSGTKYNEYGSKMIKRAIVRFIVNARTKTPYLLLEKMYPSGDRPTINKFISFIKERTDNKFEVKYGPDGLREESYIPLSSSVASLSEHERPYRDTHIQFMKDLNNPTATFEKDQAELIAKIQTTIQNAILTNLKLTDFKEYKDIKPVIKTFKRTRCLDYNYWNNYNTYMGTALGTQFAQKIITQTKESPEHWIKSSIINYFGNKDRSKEIFMDCLMLQVNNTNINYARNNNFQQLPLLTKVHANIIANKVLPKMDSLLKEEIKKYTIQKSEPLPIPDYVKLLS